MYNTRKKRTRTTQSRISKTSHAAGQSAEAAVERAADVYHLAGRATVRKRYEPYKRVGRPVGRTFKAVNIDKGGPDFEVFLPNGRAGYIEVKSRSGSLIRLDAVGPAQASDLGRLAGWGHIAGVLVRLGGLWYFVEWSQWRHESKKSLNASDLERVGHGVPLMVNGAPDWLRVLEGIYSNRSGELCPTESS